MRLEDLDEAVQFVSDSLIDELGCGDVLPGECLDEELSVMTANGYEAPCMIDLSMAYDMLEESTQLIIERAY